MQAYQAHSGMLRCVQSDFFKGIRTHCTNTDMVGEPYSLPISEAGTKFLQGYLCMDGVYNQEIFPNYPCLFEPNGPLVILKTVADNFNRKFRDM